MTTEQIEMTVIIPTYNSARTMGRCINSLLHQDLPRKYFEIIIVDDGSSDNTFEVLREYPVKAFKIKRSGPYKARNYGAKRSIGKILVFTDADCTCERDWLTKIKNIFKNTNIDAIQGPGNLTKQKNIWVIAECARLTMTKRDFWGDTKNLAVRKSIFIELGGFNERFPTGGDVEFVYRLRKLKKKVFYSKNLKVYHWWPENPFILLKNALKYAFGDFLFEKRIHLDYAKVKLRFISRSLKWSYLRRFNYLNFEKDRTFSRFEKILIFLYIFFNTNFRSLATMNWYFKYYRPR